MNETPLTYATRPDATAERERASLAAVLSILFEEDEKAAASPGDGREYDGKDDLEDPADGGIIRHAS